MMGETWGNSQLFSMVYPGETEECPAGPVLEEVQGPEGLGEHPQVFPAGRCFPRCLGAALHGSERLGGSSGSREGREVDLGCVGMDLAALGW